MKKRDFAPELWQFVMDSSSLINIERTRGLRPLIHRRGAILIPEQVAYEVARDPRIRKRDPLRIFILDNPDVVTSLRDDEEDQFYSIFSQGDIGAGEASAMAVALKRGLTLVIDERETKATGKAQNHGIDTLSSGDFLQRT